MKKVINKNTHNPSLRCALSLTQGKLITLILSATQSMVYRKKGEREKTVSYTTTNMYLNIRKNTHNIIQKSKFPNSLTLSNSLQRIVSKGLVFIISGMRPLLGPASCRYTVTCTPFAIEQLKTQPLHRALWYIIKRVASCNPLR
jgi:hypothetical protein